jgi:hypothetical protein
MMWRWDPDADIVQAEFDERQRCGHHRPPQPPAGSYVTGALAEVVCVAADAAGAACGAVRRYLKQHKGRLAQRKSASPTRKRPAGSTPPATTMRP